MPQWPRSTGHARGQAIVLAVMLWTAAAAVGFAGTSDRGIAGPLKGADFVHFYTLGHLASSERIEPLYDPARLFEAQVALVPESKHEIYPPVYPPQAAVFFAPFAGLSYQRALLLWNLLTIAGYALIVWSAWTAVAHRLPDRTLLVAAAAAFPPFWSLILHGQATLIVLASFWAGWFALERRRPWLAGFAFALMAFKPQFGIPLAVVVLMCREWAMLAGALSSVAAQAAVVWLVLGSAVLKAYAAWVPMTIAYADRLEVKAFMSHSLRALTRLAPNWIGVPLWVALAAVVLWLTVRVWKSHAPVRVRVGVVVLASTLVNPHLIVYDLTILVLPIIWLGAYMVESCTRRDAGRFWTTVYWVFAATFMPTAAVIGLQASVLLIVWLLVLVAKAVRTAPGALAPGMEPGEPDLLPA